MNNTQITTHDIALPNIPFYAQSIDRIITLLNGKTSFKYKKTFRNNITITFNEFIQELDKLKINFELFHIDDNHYNMIFFPTTGEPVYLYINTSSRNAYQILLVEVFGNELTVVENVESLINDLLKPHLLDYDTINIKWYFAGSDGIDYNYFEEKSVPSLNVTSYPYIKDIIKKIDEYILSNESVLLLIGPPGTGKTSLIRYILSRYNTLMNVKPLRIDDAPTIRRRFSEDSSYVYYTAEERVLQSDQMFISFATQAQALMVLEDIDIHLSARNEGNVFMYKLLGSSDGLIKNVNRKIIISTNLPNVKDIDDALIRPGRCFGVFEFRKLNLEESITCLQELEYLEPDAGFKEKAHQLQFVEPSAKLSFTLAELYSNSFSIANKVNQ